jgi:hypothetical protein
MLFFYLTCHELKFLISLFLWFPQTREKKQSKLEQSGLSEAELLRQQEELFGAAREKYNQGPAE